ncbi:hypothetical protein QM012_003063 [Aureobasidium pullulans]|uniref:Uncharacterized protein n=1 Tax=Aureobasidium pullulans TaxID=5580 RepID=A0ABR0TAI4_AURPU
MHEDSIQKASSVEVAERRKSSVLRPTITRGDSFLEERDGGRKLDDISRPGLGLTRLSSSRIPLSRGSSYQPDWAQDAEEMSAPPVPVEELGSPEDLKDMLRMGRTQEMRRVFKQFSLISFGCLSQCTWEFVLLCVVFRRLDVHHGVAGRNGFHDTKLGRPAFLGFGIRE